MLVPLLSIGAAIVLAALVWFTCYSGWQDFNDPHH